MSWKTQSTSEVLFVPEDNLPLGPEAEICTSEVSDLCEFIYLSFAPQALTSKTAGLLQTKFLLTNSEEFLPVCEQWLQKGPNPYWDTWQHVKNISLTQSRNLPESPLLHSTQCVLLFHNSCLSINWNLLFTVFYLFWKTLIKPFFKYLYIAGTDLMVISFWWNPYMLDLFLYSNIQSCLYFQCFWFLLKTF